MLGVSWKGVTAMGRRGGKCKHDIQYVLTALCMAAVSLGLLLGGMEWSREPKPLLVRQAGEGLWQVEADGRLTRLSRDFSGVMADGVLYQLSSKKGTWNVLADGEIIAQGEPSEEPVWLLSRYTGPIPLIGSLAELDGWLYFLLTLEDNTNRLCRVQTDGTGFELFMEYDVFPVELLPAEGRVVLRVRAEDGYAYPAAFDPETKEITVLSDIQANISNRFYVDGDKVWWTFNDQEQKKAIQCSVPVTGGETEILDLEYVSFVGGGNILIGNETTLQVMDIDGGEVETYALPFDDWSGVHSAADWGAVVSEEQTSGRDYWLLRYDTGVWTRLTLE